VRIFLSLVSSFRVLTAVPLGFTYKRQMQLQILVRVVVKAVSRQLPVAEVRVQPYINQFGNLGKRSEIRTCFAPDISVFPCLPSMFHTEISCRYLGEMIQRRQIKHFSLQRLYGHQNLIQNSHQLIYEHQNLIQNSHQLIYEHQNLIQNSHQLIYEHQNLIRNSHQLIYEHQNLIQNSHQLNLPRPRKPKPKIPHCTSSLALLCSLPQSLSLDKVLQTSIGSTFRHLQM